jgi:hypothetical protein
MILVPRSRGPTPDKNNRFPTRRACGYKPTGSGAFDELIICFSSIIFRDFIAGDIVNLKLKSSFSADLKFPSREISYCLEISFILSLIKDSIYKAKSLTDAKNDSDS